MTTPEISIVMPVYNGQTFLPETIASIQSQTFSDFEVVCVDDGSTDKSVELLRQTILEDPRFRLIQQKNAGAGAARNRGFDECIGNYVIFLDSDDLFSPMLLEKLHQAITLQKADIAACNFSRFTPEGKEYNLEGVHPQWIPKGAEVFSYRDCPDRIMSVINPTPWNKLYRADFIRKHELRYEELSSTNDITFAAVSVAMADKIVPVKESLVRYRIGHSGSISSAKSGKLNNVKAAVLRAAEQALALPYSDQIRNSIICFVADNFLYALSRYLSDFSSPQAKAFYTMVHETFNRKEFADANEKSFVKPEQYGEFCTVKKHSYEAMLRLIRRRLIVSLTTYPKRIHLIPRVLESIDNQTRKPDEIVLWLAEEQFPQKEAELPEELIERIRQGNLTLRWCDDLKPHKKYFYAFQEYPDDLVVTIDDDLTYSSNLLSSLYASYLWYPDAISTVRAHLIIVDENHQILPYSNWIQESDACLHKTSMQLIATNGAGVLHPPELYPKETFDKAALMENCLWADDIWLKTMQLIADVPVVVARPHEPLAYLPDSQSEGLHTYNVRKNQNDVQLANISRWLDTFLEPNILSKKLSDHPRGEQILGVTAVSSHLDKERRDARTKQIQANKKFQTASDKLRQTESQKKAVQSNLTSTQAKLTQAQTTLKQKDAALAQAQARIRQLQETQKQTQQKLTQSEQLRKQAEASLRKEKENAPISRQLKNLGAQIRVRREKGEKLLPWSIKYGVYLLAWIPEKILAVMMYYLRNGAKESAKHLMRKLLRKG